jgi:hypothetical protein
MEIQLIRVEALGGYRMDFQSPDELDTGLKARGTDRQEQKAQGARPRQSKHPGEEPGW